MADLAIEISPAPRPALVRLRVATNAAGAAARALELPSDAGTYVRGDPERFWLGPDQWLLASTTCSAQHLLDACAHALEHLRHHAVDASAGLDRLRVRGSRARTLLQMGTGVDVRSPTLGTGRCVRTRFARVPVVLIARDGEVFELIVDRSYTDYLRRWLERAATDPLVAA